MNLKKLLTVAAAIVVASFAYTAKADTNILTAEKGYTKITSLPSNLSDYYFIIVDRDNDLMMTLGQGSEQGSGNKTMWYRTSVDPTTDLNRVWEIEANGSGFSFRNPGYDILLLQTEYEKAYHFRTNDQPSSDNNNWTRFLLAYNTDSWTIENGQYPMSSTSSYKGFLGPWNNVIEDGAEVACNKQDNTVGHFCIYSILKTDYQKLYLQNDEPSQAENTDMTWCLFNEGFEIYGNSASWGLGWNGTGKGNKWDMFVRQKASLGNHNGVIAEMWGSSGVNAQDLNQTMAALPNGKYKLGVGIVSYNATTTLYVKDGDKTLNSLDILSEAKESSLKSLEFEVYNASNITYGLSVPSTVDAKKETWVGVDNFTLTCVDLYLSAAAETFTGTGSLEAGKWYVYDVASEGTYALSTTTGIVYTQTDALSSEASTEAVTVEMELTAGKFYFKSETAQELSITPQNYTYVVGSAITDISFIQNGNTVTVSYADLLTNNSNATATINFGGVTFGGNAIEITPTANGFTFAVPEVTANTSYVLSIPAKAIGYEAGNIYNEAQEITLNAPAVLDGTYYFRVENETAKNYYLSRGRAYGTHAAIDAYGLPIIVKTDGKNQTTLSPADTKRYYFHADQYNMYADATEVSANAMYTIIKDGDTYKIQSNAKPGLYLKHNDGDVNSDNLPVYDDGNGSNSGPIILWSVETLAEHATAMAALKNKQAATAATTAISDNAAYSALEGVTTIEDIEAAVANLIESAFVPATEVSSVVEKFQGDQPGNGNTVETVYSNTIDIAKPGLYKFSMQAFYRAASNAVTQSLHTGGADFPPVVLFFGSAKTQIKSLYDEVGSSETLSNDDAKYNELYYANNTGGALKEFQAGKYHNDVWLYIDQPGTYTYGVQYMGFANRISQWFIYSPQSVTITSYSGNATTEDYAALNAAINAAKDKTLGFDEGEYAPYNNVDGIKALATANSIDQSTTNGQLLVQSATEALTSATWTVNETEVNAIAGGEMLDSYTHVGGYDCPNGWSNTGYNTRICGITESLVEKNPGLAGTNNSRAMLVKYSTTYGETNGYTLPLNGNTAYKFTFNYGLWDENVLVKKNLFVIAPDGTKIPMTPDAVSKQEGDKAICANKLTTAWYEYAAVFTTTEAGDYVLHIENADGSNQRQMVFYNLQLKKSPEVTATMNISAAKWGTFIAPFEVETPEGVTAYTITGISEEDNTALVFEEVEGSAIAANTPVMVYSAEPLNKSFTAQSLATQNEYTEGQLTGVLEGRAAKDGEYILQNKAEGGLAFYLVNTSVATPNIPAYRCFLTVPATGEAKAFFTFGGEATAIEAIDALTSGAVEAIYTLNGVRVNSLQKGVNIVKMSNGKTQKVLVK